MDTCALAGSCRSLPVLDQVILAPGLTGPQCKTAVSPWGIFWFAGVTLNGGELNHKNLVRHKL